MKLGRALRARPRCMLQSGLSRLHLIDKSPSTGAKSTCNGISQPRRSVRGMGAAAHSAQPDPGQQSHRLASQSSSTPTPSNVPLSDILAALADSPNVKLSYSDLANFLSHPSDASSLIALMPYVETTARSLPMAEATDLIAGLLRQMAQHNMLALIGEVLRFFLVLIEQTIAHQPDFASPIALESSYSTIIEALTKFDKQSTLALAFSPSSSADREIHRSVQPHILRLVRSLTHHLERLPSSSTRNLTLSPDMLGRVFRPPVLHPALMRFLLHYTQRNGIECASWMWWQCCLIAIGEGNARDARRYKGRAGHMAKAEARTRDQGPANEQEGKTEPRVISRITPDGRDGSPLKMKSAIIPDMVNARNTPSIEKMLKDLKPRLYDVDTDTASHAWSHLFHASRTDPAVDASTLAYLRASIPPESISGHTLTPAMLAFLDKGDVSKAWEVWRDLVDRHNQTHSSGSEVYVDRAALAVGTYVCHALSGLDAAVELVDAWAMRPSTDRRRAARVDAQQSTVLDAQNVNVLLMLCRQARRPSVALRIFTASLPRWGVYTDDISLTLLLDTCRFQSAPVGRPADGSGAEAGAVPDIRDRLRQLADDLHLSRSRCDKQNGSRGGFEAYDAAGFARGPTSVLLDPPGYSWRQDHPYPPWSMARGMFQDIVLSNWPFFANTPSPLDFERGPYAHQVIGISSFFRSQPPKPHSPPTDLLLGRCRLASPGRTGRIDHLHLVPSANTFNSYVALLGYHNRPHEIPLVLAWMRELQIVPSKRTMLLALTYLGEVEGPSRFLRHWGPGGQSRLVTDSEVLRRWLTEWVVKGVPTEDDVATFRRNAMQANRRLTAL